MGSDEEKASLTEGEKGLLALVQSYREQLALVDPEEIARRCAVEYIAEDAQFVVPVFGQGFTVTFPELRVMEETTDHHEGSPWLQALVMHYFRTADGFPIEGTWISFRDLPGGMHYEKAFQGYSGDQLAKAFGNDLQRLERAARLAKGKPISIGDVGYTFAALPRVPIAVSYWSGDEDFPPAAKVLFDRSASHYLPTDALATLGGRLCRLLIRGGDLAI